MLQRSMSSSTTSTAARTTIPFQIKSFLNVSPEALVAEGNRESRHHHHSYDPNTFAARSIDLDSCKSQQVRQLQQQQQQQQERVEEYQMIVRNHAEFTLSQKSATSSTGTTVTSRKKSRRR